LSSLRGKGKRQVDDTKTQHGGTHQKGKGKPQFEKTPVENCTSFGKPLKRGFVFKPCAKDISPFVSAGRVRANHSIPKCRTDSAGGAGPPTE